MPDKNDKRLMATRSPESKALVEPEISAIVSPWRTGLAIFDRYEKQSLGLMF